MANGLMDHLIMIDGLCIYKEVIETQSALAYHDLSAGPSKFLNQSKDD